MSTEELYVKNTYNKIATHFDHTRYKSWTCVEHFLNKIPPGSMIADIGCGNGKNMYRKDCQLHGCDFSEKLVDICRNKGLNVIYGDVTSIPYSSESFDYVICIAVIHHISSLENRKLAISELQRITKKGGQILVLVWAFEKDKIDTNSSQDTLIPWKDKQQNIMGMRYYHLFCKNELENLVHGNEVSSFYERENWGIIIDVQ